MRGHNDEGGASRFFPVFRYQAKAPTRERPSYEKDGAGFGAQNYGGYKVRCCDTCGTRFPATGPQPCEHDGWSWQEPLDRKPDRVAHPTVKPLDLMRWLVRLVTPPNGVVLDPFAGSGTTVEAAVLEGFRCIAIEREAEYLPLIMQRLERVAATPPAEDGGLFEAPEKKPGRWPTNVVLGASQAAELDKQSGILRNGGQIKPGARKPPEVGATGLRQDQPTQFSGDSGGASRFFPVFEDVPLFELDDDGDAA